MSTAAISGKFVDLCHDLAKVGWLPGRPKDISSAAIKADGDTLVEAICEECCRHGLVHMPFHRRDGQPGYRALKVCPDCGHSEEW